MIKPQSHVLVDTNVIIESHRVGCWKALINHFEMDTVEKCVEECETGNRRNFNPVPVNVAALVKDVQPKKIGQKELNALSICYSDAIYLDPGERHLLAYALTLKNAFFVCSPDKMCVIAGSKIGINECPACKSAVRPAALCRTCGQDFVKLKFTGEDKAPPIPNDDFRSDENTGFITPQIHVEKLDDVDEGAGFFHAGSAGGRQNSGRRL